MTEPGRPAPIEVGGTPVWTQPVHGLGGHNPLFDPAGTALYVSDGWGNRPVPGASFPPARSGERGGDREMAVRIVGAMPGAARRR